MYLQDSLEAYLSIASAKALQDNFLSGKKRAERTFPTMLLLTQRLRGGRAAVSVTFLERQR